MKSLRKGRLIVNYEIRVLCSGNCEVVSRPLTSALQKIMDQALRGELIILNIVSKPLDIDCIGEWSICNSDCKKEYSITTPQLGEGVQCSNEPGDEETCEPGEGECVTNCSGEWGECEKGIYEDNFLHKVSCKDKEIMDCPEVYDGESSCEYRW